MSATETPHVAQRTPIQVEVQEGKSYWWCACGRSAKQPFCDGSHKGGPFGPLEYKATQTGTVWFCGCKHTSKQPRCDGSHKRV
jgi:CDGSH-type Zn-finger protein